MSNTKLIVLSGLPAVGKSTIAEAIAKKLGFAVFSVDPIESAIVSSGIKRSFETGLAAYLVAKQLADEQLKLGHSVVIDAVNAEDEGKQIWIDLGKKHGLPLIVIECVNSDTSLHKQRIEERRRNLHGIAEVTWEDVEKRSKKYTKWQQDTLVLDTSKPLEINTQKALDYIDS